jgi:hypothetical protein
MKQVIFLMILSSLIFLTHEKDAKECEVCERVVNKLSKSLPDNPGVEEVEAAFKKFCKEADGKEEKFVSLFWL